MRDSLGTWERVVGFLTAIALASSLILAFLASSFLGTVEQKSAPSFVSIGQFIAGPFAPALELLALVLAAAVLGAVMLAKVEGRDEP
jgi:NADH:ubiquinone oxidoreductase subunit 6 (subunit J)